MGETRVRRRMRLYQPGMVAATGQVTVDVGTLLLRARPLSGLRRAIERTRFVTGDDPANGGTVAVWVADAQTLHEAARRYLAIVEQQQKRPEPADVAAGVEVPP